jgi:hypothetical protein
VGSIGVSFSGEDYCVYSLEKRQAGGTSDADIV